MNSNFCSLSLQSYNAVEEKARLQCRYSCTTVMLKIKFRFLCVVVSYCSISFRPRVKDFKKILYRKF